MGFYLLSEKELNTLTNNTLSGLDAVRTRDEWICDEAVELLSDSLVILDDLQYYKGYTKMNDEEIKTATTEEEVKPAATQEEKAAETTEVKAEEEVKKVEEDAKAKVEEPTTAA